MIKQRCCRATSHIVPPKHLGGGAFWHTELLQGAGDDACGDARERGLLLTIAENGTVSHVERPFPTRVVEDKCRDQRRSGLRPGRHRRWRIAHSSARDR